MHLLLSCLLFISYIMTGESSSRPSHHRSRSPRPTITIDTTHKNNTTDTSKTDKKQKAVVKTGKEDDKLKQKDETIAVLRTELKTVKFQVIAYQSLLIAFVLLSIIFFIFGYSKYTNLVSAKVPYSSPTRLNASPPEQRNQDPTPASNNINLNKLHPPVKGDWLITGASVIGQSHTIHNKPCQDHHLIDILNDKWGIAIVCDGAGSAANSDLGSKYASQQMANYLKREIVLNKWVENEYLPSQKDWEEIAFRGYGYTLSKVKNFAQEKSLPQKSLACTVIAVVYSPQGLLVTHVGDGRAAWCDHQGNWKPLIKPHKGQEANETIFLTSDDWINPEAIGMSGVNVPESKIIREKVQAFSLMSDGCEAHSFLSSQIDPNTNMWSDPNQPFTNFFNPIVTKLREMQKMGLDQKAISSNWEKFLINGTPGLQKEPDDKTMIIGILN